MEAQETQNGKGLEKVLDKSRKQSKNHAVERIRTEGVLGNLWMRGHSAAKRVSSTQHVQHEVVFSCAMSIMDAIYGWEDEEKRVGSKFAACMWIYTKEVLTRGQILNPEMEEYLKKRMMSIMVCTSWVCPGGFRRSRMGVSESTQSQHAEEVMGMELDYEIGIPCVVQWCMLWITRLNGTLKVPRGCQHGDCGCSFKTIWR